MPIPPPKAEIKRVRTPIKETEKFIISSEIHALFFIVAQWTLF
jgi:hypothetical protein